MKMNRRGLLGLIGAGAAVPVVAEASAGAVAFAHGVASGDPHADSVVLWTRVTPAAGSTGAVPVIWRVRPMGSDTVVASGRVEATVDRDFTVKVIATGLAAGRGYRFDFRSGEARSPEGRTRTLPTGAIPDAVLAVVSCQLYPGGLFNAYDAISKLERLDAVVHLGDYIYEYGAEADDYGMVTGAALSRLPQPPHEIVSLDDYRLRHAQYKSDPDLQAAHARAPFICVWDDHEVANDTWNAGAQNHQPETEGAFSTRKAAALRAYYEWMPIREPQAGALKEAIQRTFHFGDLASLIMVETRLQGRTEQLDYARDLTFKAGPDGKPAPDVEAFLAKRADPARDLLDDAQRGWLTGELRASREAGRPWQVLGNQVVMARVAGPNVAAMMPPEAVQGFLAGLPESVRAEVAMSVELFRLGMPFNLDAWDGYPTARERLYQAFKAANVQPIVLAGDSHAFWVNDLKDGAGDRRAVEFGTSSISSPSPGDAIGGGFPLGQLLTATNPEVVFCDQSAKGYILLTLDRTTVKADLTAVSTILAKPYQTRVVNSWRVTRDTTGLTGPVEV